MSSSHRARHTYPRALHKRAAVPAAITAAVLLLAGAVGPAALAGPISAVNTFDAAPDPSEWGSYDNSGVGTTSAVTGGEFCHAVPTTSSGNAWDIAMQRLNVPFVNGTTYKVSFDAHASRAVNVPFQAGTGWPNVHQGTVALDGSSTPQPYEYTFTPTGWGSTGTVDFQLGNLGTGFDFCIDNFSLTTVNTFDAAPDPSEWGSYDNSGAGTASAVTGGEYCHAVPTTTSGNAWDIAMQRLNVPFVNGTTYKVSFDAHASRAVNVPFQAGTGWPNVHQGTVALDGTSTPHPYEYTFTPTGWDSTGTVDFQLGNLGAGFDFCIDNFSLTTVNTFDAAPDPSEWGSYDNSGVGTAAAVTGGEYCHAVPTTTSGNAWDIAMQRLNVPFVNGTTYKVSFDAHASRAVNVPFQAGTGWPNVHQDSVALDGSSTPKPYEYTFTPTGWDSTGTVDFQLGNLGTGFNFCIDNFSLTTVSAGGGGGDGAYTFDAAPDPSEWASYDNSGAGTASAVTGGEYCHAVPTTTSGNAWDIAMQRLNVPFVNGTTYKVSFDAHASRAVNVPFQAGTGWPNVHQGTVALDGTSTPHRYEYTFTPTGWGSTGTVDFQLGNLGTGFDFCIDNFSLTTVSAGGGGTPADTEGWTSYSNPPGSDLVTTSVVAGEVCTAVDPHTGNAWDIALQRDNVAYVDGTTYTASFDAHASRAVTVPFQGGGDYPDVFDAYQVALNGSTTPQHFDVDFTPTGWSAPAGNIGFQLGNQGAAFDLCVDNFSIVVKSTGGGTPADTEGWISYSNPPGSDLVTSGVVAGEVCAAVDPHTGNAWDIALQQDNVAFVDGTTYTASFDAHASRAVTVPFQGGGAYPDVFTAYQVALNGSTTPQHFEYDFTPSGWSAPAGNVAFQLGNRGAAFDFCVDNFSIVVKSVAGGGGTPADTAHWISYSNPPGSDLVTSDVVAGEVCAAVDPHTGNAWDIALQQDNVAYVNGTTYTASFDAHASRALTVPLQGGGAYPEVFTAYQVALNGSTTPQHFQFDFTPSGWSAPAGTVAFQLGNQGAAFDLCVDNFSIVVKSVGGGTAPDTAHWISYSNPPGSDLVTSDVVAGEVCAAVKPHKGNAWDIALQQDNVAYVDGTTYTASFDAHASRALTVPLQGGGTYPDVFTAYQVALNGSTTPQHFQFDFTPSGWSAPAGTVAFQLGDQGAAFDLCVDNFSIVVKSVGAPGGDTRTLVSNGDFASGTLGQWWVNGIKGNPRFDNGQLCVAVPGGTTKPWDVMVGQSGIPVRAGSTYALKFDASSTANRPVRAILGEEAEPYRTPIDKNPPLSKKMKTFEYFATPTFSIPSGQVAFQLGGSAKPWTFCLDNVSLRDGAVQPPYVPETGSSVRVNQVGYLPDGPKRATLVTDENSPVAWELRAGAKVVATGKTKKAGLDPTAGVKVHTIDFGKFTTPGTYTLVAGGEESYPFVIAADIYQKLRYDAMNYFYPVRSGIAIDGSIMGDARYTRPAGHVGNPDSAGANQGDNAVPCITPAEAKNLYGDWTCNYTLNVTGGWYDAGDHGKYVVNGGIAVAQLLSTYERTLTAPTAGTDLGDGSLNIPNAEQSNGVPDVLDEARWELDFMMSMQVPAGKPLHGMVHHKVHDVDWTGFPLLPSNDPQERRLHRPSTAATLNLAAAAAQGARLWDDYDPAYAKELLAAARTAYNAAVANPELYQPAPNADPSPGGGPYDDSDVSDEFYWAAAELFLTTGEQKYQDAVLASPLNDADIWSAGGLSWGATAGFGRLDLATVESELPGRTAIRESVVDGAEKYLAWQKSQPFGTAYPGSEGNLYEWGSNASVLNNQVVLGTAFDLTADKRFADAVLESMDYLLGRNALNNSYVTGYGDVFSTRQHSRWFANSMEPSLPTPPPGSVAGGPNSRTKTWDPVIGALYTKDHMCAPQLCYVDEIQSWSTNEITINWNSAMSWVASFVADQQAGDRSGAGRVAWVVTDPVGIQTVAGADVTFTTAVRGQPAPSVQWQRLEDGVWTDLPNENDTRLDFTAVVLADSGTLVRAYVSNEFGGAYTDPATLSVLSGSQGKKAPAPAPSSNATGAGPARFVLAALGLLGVLGGGVSSVAGSIRWRRRGFLAG